MEKNIDVGNDEIFFQQERENILDKVKKIYENKLVEKDNEIVKLKSKQLFKEDFEPIFDIHSDLTDFNNVYVIKDNSKYDKLDSKDVK